MKRQPKQPKLLQDKEREAVLQHCPLKLFYLLYFTDEYPQDGKTPKPPPPLYSVQVFTASDSGFTCCFVRKNYTGLQWKTAKSFTISSAPVQSKLLPLLISAGLFLSLHMKLKDLIV